MSVRFIFMLCIFRTIEVVLAIEDKFECVKRKSGACKTFNVSEDFDHFIDLKALGHHNHLNTIIEFDYIENKYNYEVEQNKKKKEFDTFDNPVVEILFSEDKDLEYSYRLVLGEKLNRLAYLERVDEGHSIKYNNYSPDLPSWPFAINVTIEHNKLLVHTRDGDGFDKSEPFLSASSDEISVRYMSVRNRNKNVKLVSFYDCSTKYGSNCGTEMTETITDCRTKFSPLGSGFFNNFEDMSKFNRLETETEFEFDEIFGIYRRNNDSCVILFSTYKYEAGTYVRITIGDEISVRVRTFNENAYAYYEKDAIGKGWSQEPSDPNFIRIKISSKTKEISVYNLDVTNNDNDDEEEKPIVTMKLCNYFERDSIRYMSVTSNRFKTVNLYYDCCLPNKTDECHVYEKKNVTRMQIDSITTTDYISENIFESDSTTTRSEDDSTTTRSEDDSTTTRSVDDSTIIREEDDPTTIRVELPPNFGSKDSAVYTQTESQEMATEVLNISDSSDDVVDEVQSLTGGCEKTKTYLDTSNFRETGSTQYVYANGTSNTDYCPHEIEAGVQLQEITEATDTDDNEEESDHHFLSGGGGGGLSANVLRSLLG